MNVVEDSMDLDVVSRVLLWCNHRLMQKSILSLDWVFSVAQSHGMIERPTWTLNTSLPPCPPGRMSRGRADKEQRAALLEEHKMLGTFSPGHPSYITHGFSSDLEEVTPEHMWLCRWMGVLMGW